MESKKGFGKFMERVIEGRGFYIVIALCAAIIGVSIWSLLRTPAPMQDEAEFEDTLSTVEVQPASPEESVFPEDTGLPDETPVEESAAPAETPAITETAATDSAVWPVDGAVQRGYTMDALAYDETMADWRTHDGVDLAAEEGTKVLAIRGGTVLSVQEDDAFGMTVTIDHGDGLICTYAALASVPTVSAGDAVKAGDVIGSVGTTAKSETAQPTHLHLRASQNGSSIDPLAILPQRG